MLVSFRNIYDGRSFFYFLLVLNADASDDDFYVPVSK